MKISVIIASVITLILVGLYLVFQDNLPPRTPLKIARNISGLPITSDYKMVLFVEDWSDFNGDGGLRVEFDLSEEQMSQLVEKCKLVGYQSMPIQNPPPELAGALFLKNLQGLYQIKIHDQRETAFDLVVLDTKTNKLIIYVFVS